MVAVLGYSRDEIASAVREMYTAVATTPEAHFHFPVGAAGMQIAGYPHELTEGLPEAAVASFAGVGCPFRAGTLPPGEQVLDVGSGAGVDSMIAGRMVGQGGKVYALDMTPAMSAKLRDTAAKAGIENLEIREGTAENIPLSDASVDVIVSNGVLNLVPDKRRAMREMFRVLRPGGRMQIADIVIKRPVTPDCLGDPKLWAECVVGATVDEDYLEMFRDAGFEEVEVVRSFDYFAHSPSPETREVARSFDARAIELRMRRAETPPRWIGVLARRVSPKRLARQIGRRGMWGIVAFALAAVACYGAIAALAGLSLLGISLTLDDGVWSAAIGGLAVATALVVAAGWRKHRRWGPTMLAVGGSTLIGYTMIVAYHGLLEAAGFALLAAGVFWDYRIRRYAGSPRARGVAGRDSAAAANPSALT
ncbi:MAG: methyltransferase domain-containing protein [Alphaproteobacteria bacterium]|nr:methyltransferase domain-containing protein [Alphaproteobacteria bacterium]